MYVTLASNSPSYDGPTGVFSVNVTVQNLMAQPLGTSDGTAADTGGVKVFFSSGPTGHGGTGTVTVANRDSTTSFTGPNQPYFKYPGILASGATSSAKAWDFQLTGTIDSFDFQVYVTAEVPQASGILRWLRDSLSPDLTTYGIWGTSASNVYAVGQTFIEQLSRSQLLNWNGSAWDSVAGFSTDLMWGVGGSGNTLVAVGTYGVVYYSSNAGATWNRVTISAAPFLNSAWASSPTDLYAAGSGGVIYRSSNGTTWSPVTVPATFLYQVWGTSATDLFAVGVSGAVLHSTNGTTWAQGTIPSGFSGTTFYGVGGVSGGPFFAVGDGGTVLRSSDDGSTWSAVASGTTNNLNGVTCSTASDCIAVGDLGSAVAWNGSVWVPLATGSTHRMRGVWGAGESAVFATGDTGTMQRGVR
ncbi:MAG TPA: hypothetical protein VMG41_13475 [Gemmatimonadales bacterium]|nr:hypothetical protein [Gemmatimonadales bacterium]